MNIYASVFMFLCIMAKGYWSKTKRYEAKTCLFHSSQVYLSLATTATSVREIPIRRNADKEREQDSMARLTDEAFRAWCQRNQDSPATEVYIQRIRSSQPVRKVQSGASNVSGRYPNVKMCCSIQFESQYVELWGIYTMERDDDVLEYYDQPTRIQLHYHARSGRKTSPWHTLVFGNGASTMTATPAMASRPHTISRIEREAFRDPIGDQVTNALKCSFSGVLSIELKQFLGRGIRLFECPECARMRSLSPHNDVLRFPSHDQRKRLTPHTEQRWAREKTIWEVVGGESK
jgi:hypothetical protein